MKEEIFISCLDILLLFNIFVVFTDPSYSSVLSMSMVSIIVTGLVVAILSSITIFGSGLSDSATKIIFASIILLNVLFQVDFYYDPYIPHFVIGLGLASTINNVFTAYGDVMGIGALIASTLSFITFFSGIMIVAEDA